MAEGLRAAASLLLEQGVCQVRGAVSPASLQPLRVAHDRRAAEVIVTLEAHRESRRGKPPGEVAPSEFELACVRDGARLDLVGLPAPQEAVDQAERAWLPVVSALLGRDLRRLWVGSFLALPAAEGCSHQPWHTDAPHLFNVQLPPHALNVFLPLADVNLDDGPTEFRPGTHLLGNEANEMSVALRSRAGDFVIYDYRVQHRGLVNRSDEPRRVLYFTYAKSWWRDANKGASTAGM